MGLVGGLRYWGFQLLRIKLQCLHEAIPREINFGLSCIVSFNLPRVWITNSQQGYWNQIIMWGMEVMSCHYNCQWMILLFSYTECCDIYYKSLLDANRRKINKKTDDHRMACRRQGRIRLVSKKIMIMVLRSLTVKKGLKACYM